MALAGVAACVVGAALRTPAIALLFQRGSFTVTSTHLVAAVFLGFAPALAGWSLMEVIARSLFALERPRLPAAAAAIPVAVNLVVTSIFYQRGMLTNPALVGLGASAGLLAGFATLFAAVHLRRRGSPGAVSRTSRKSSACDPAPLL
jgi:putative peptidoglycan lipid II flippase